MAFVHKSRLFDVVHCQFGIVGKGWFVNKSHRVSKFGLAVKFCVCTTEQWLAKGGALLLLGEVLYPILSQSGLSQKPS